MRGLKTQLIVLIVAVIVGILVGVYIDRTLFNSKAEENKNLLKSLNSELVVWKDKDSINHAKIAVIETKRAKDFIKLESNDSLVKQLQATVKKHKSKLKNKGSVTNVSTTTEIKATAETQIIEIDSNYTEYRSNFNIGGWVIGTTSSNKNTTTIDFVVTNDFSVIIGEDSNGWFKKSTPFVEIMFSNSDTEIETLRTYQVSAPRVNRIILGPAFIVGIDGNVMIGVGVMYGLIMF